MKKQKYDLVFSLGEACSSTSSLRRAGLQFKSYPLDWLFGSDFIGRCKIVASCFKRFLEYSDLEYSYSERSISCDAYHNKYNDLTFNHDFGAGLDLKQTYPAVKDKYDRRISRLLTSINGSNSVLIVYIETPVKNHPVVDDNTLIQGCKILAEAFPNTKIDLLYFSHSETKKQTVMISNHITRIYDDYKDKHSSLDYTVTEKRLIKHLRNIKLNIPLSIRIKRKIRNVLINLIPFKQIRHNMQRKYHVKK